MPSDNRLLFTVGINNLDIYPKTSRHLVEYRERLVRRRGCNTEQRWYKFKEEQNYDMAEDFELRIITTYRGQYPRFAIAKQGWHGCTDTYSLVPHDTSGWDVYGMAAILNSSLIRMYFDVYGKKKGQVIEFFTRPIQNLPIPGEIDPRLSELGRAITRKAEDLVLALLLDQKRLLCVFQPDFDQVLKKYKEIGGKSNKVTILCLTLHALEREVDAIVRELYKLPHELAIGDSYATD